MKGCKLHYRGVNARGKPSEIIVPIKRRVNGHVSRSVCSFFESTHTLFLTLAPLKLHSHILIRLHFAATWAVCSDSVVTHVFLVYVHAVVCVEPG